MHIIKNEKGFTLVEALLATAVLSIGIITLITMQTTVVKGNSKARGITTAATWGQDKIEELVNADFDTIANGNQTSPDGHYQISWTVDQNIMLTNPGLGIAPADRPVKKILVTVSRNDFGLQRAVTLTYYRQKYF